MCENSKISQCIHHNKILTMIKSHVTLKLISSTVKNVQIFELYILAALILQDIYPCSTSENWNRN